MNRILVTDSLFIGRDEEQLIRDAGFIIDRLDVPAATEDQLVKAIEGKVGYILGGVETVTEPVIQAADALRVIAFTGSGFEEFIPAWRAATSRGIAITSARGANARSVAEFSVAAALSQVRQLPGLMAPSGPSFAITSEFADLTVGVVGYGTIGRIVASIYVALGFRVLASTDTPSEGVEASTVDGIVAEADVVSIHVSKGRGDSVLDAARVDALRPGAIVVNAAFASAIDNEALLRRLRAGELRAAVDYPLDASGVPVGTLIASNGQTGFNTVAANKRTSQRATAALLAVLAGDATQDLVNPEYSQAK